MWFRELDAFPKTVEDFRVRTGTGGVISLVGLAVVAALVLSELWALTTREAGEDVVVDRALDETLTIHFDITFPRLQCQGVAIEAVDAAGGSQSMAEHAVFKLALDDKRHAVGHVSQQDAQDSTLLSHDELERKKADHELEQARRAQTGGAQDGGKEPEPAAPQHTKCGSCYGLKDAAEPLKCCNTCEDVRQAFLYRSWEWRESGRDRFWQCREEHIWSKAADHEHREREVAREVGCEVFGSIFVAKAKGSFHFGASGGLATRDFLLSFFGLAESHLDMTHEIHSLWFGDVRPDIGAAALATVDSRERGESPPLEGVKRELKGPSLVQYYLKIIGTDVEFDNHTVVSYNQYAATEHIRPVTRGSLPSLHFFYDTPPLRLRYTEQHKTWSHFLVNVCAMAGGIFTVMGMLDSVAYRSAFARRSRGKG